MEATPSATVTRKPDHRGERGISRKPLRAGTPGESGCNRGDYARVLYFISHARLRVRWHPAFPPPSLGERSLHNPGGFAPRECGTVFFRHCERSEATQLPSCRDDGCFASLAMTISRCLSPSSRTSEPTGRRK